MKRNKIHNVSQFLAKQNLEEFSLQKLMKPIIIVAQCFAFMPVTGITKTVEKLKFKWTSFRTLYTLFAITLQCFLGIVTCIDTINKHDNFFGLAAILWWIRTVTGSIILLRIAQTWPILLKKWIEIEEEMLSYGPPEQLRQKFKIIAFAYLILGVVEHSIYVYGVSKLILSTIKENENFFEKYITFLNEGFFRYFQYNIFYGILWEFSTLNSTFMWQFCNLLVVLLSTALAERFLQINTAIRTSQNLTELQWRNIRKQYNRLALLCKTVNNTLAEVILLSFFGNVFFLSISIFQSFTPKAAIEATFIWYSLGYYCLHITILCLCVARVQEESIASLSQISALPVRNMSHEVDRLFNQISARDVVITGGGLFQVTRGLMLNITGVTVTLQLIFTQFNAGFNSKLS